MEKNPKIHLKIDTKFVRTCEVPALIADALYPKANFLELEVIDLHRINKINPNTKKSSFWRIPFASRPDESWYKLLSQKDMDILRQRVWLHLEPLKFPISMKDWHAYGEAFANWDTEINFDLKPDRVEWHYEPQGNEKAFYKLNRSNLKIHGMFESDSLSEENVAIQEAGMAEFRHIGLLRKAIQEGKIEQLDPNSNIPTKTYFTYGKITIKALKKYVKQFKIALQHDGSQENPPQPAESKNDNVPEQSAPPAQSKSSDNEIPANGSSNYKHQKQGNKHRTNTLDPAIDRAIKLAGGSLELAAVYLELKDLALDETSPFTGIIEGDGLCYTNDNGELKKLTKDALGKRLKRRSEPSSAGSRH